MSKLAAARRRLSDGAAIVLSILIAFAIDAGWDIRQQRREELQTAAGLAEELQANAEILRESIATGTARRESLRRAIQMSPAELAAVPLDSAWLAVVEPFFRDYWTPIEKGFLTSTVNSGKLDAIRDVEVRAALAESLSAMEEADVLRVFFAQFSREALSVLGGLDGFQDYVARPEEPQRLPTRTAILSIGLNTDLRRIGTAKLPYWGAFLRTQERLLDAIEEAQRRLRVE